MEHPNWFETREFTRLDLCGNSLRNPGAVKELNSPESEPKSTVLSPFWTVLERFDLILDLFSTVLSRILTQNGKKKRVVRLVVHLGGLLCYEVAKVPTISL